MSRQGILRPLRRGLIGAILAISVAACSQPDQTMDIVAPLERATSGQKPGETLNFATLAPFTWDRMLLAGPYTPLAELERVLAKPVPGALRSIDLDRRDDVNAAVFLNGQDIVHAQAIPRRIIDFRKADLLKPIARADARFTRAESGVGYVLVER